jgi:23S rRNA pseudouridine1911/1915/1917 synthase
MIFMSRHRITIRQTRERRIKLDEFLRIELPSRARQFTEGEPLSNSKIRRLIVAGAVNVEGKQARSPAFPVPQGANVGIFIDTDKLLFEKQPDDIAFEMSENRILFEDDAIIVVDKPAGIPTEATVVASRDHLHAAVKRFLQTRDGTRNEPYVGLHHRLDRETSGVVLFSKSRTVNPACHEIFEGHRARKEYEALATREEQPHDAARRPLSRELARGETFFVENELGRITAKSAQAKWGEVSSGGSPARTDFAVLDRYRAAMRILALPKTGRTHQIRVHLSGLGIPILGDTLYGGPSSIAGEPVPRVMLHARALIFPHPVTGTEMTVNAPIPEDFSDLAAFLERT